MDTEHLKKRSLLLIEDDSGFTALITSHLNADQWKISIAKSSAEAIKLIRQAQEPYNFALLDVWLPTEPQSSAQPYVGYQLAEQIAVISPTTKIIGMSQFIDAPSALRASGRFSAFIEKPYLIDDPKKALATCLEHGANLSTHRPSSEQATSQEVLAYLGVPWIVVAILSGLAAAALPLVFVLVTSWIIRICLIFGIAVFLVVLLLNPKRRYFSAFATTLGIWASSIVIPALRLNVDAPKFLVSFFTQGPDPFFHAAAVSIMVVLLVLDWKTRSPLYRQNKKQ